MQSKVKQPRDQKAWPKEVSPTCSKNLQACRGGTNIPKSASFPHECLPSFPPPLERVGESSSFSWVPSEVHNKRLVLSLKAQDLDRWLGLSAEPPRQPDKQLCMESQLLEQEKSRNNSKGSLATGLQHLRLENLGGEIKGGGGYPLPPPLFSAS